MWGNMELWCKTWALLEQLRPAFTRTQTFMWFCTAVTGMAIRSDHYGVTSIVRSFGLKPFCYDRILDMFHSTGIDPDRIAKLWTALVLKVIGSFLVQVNGRPVFVCDGIKMGKSGRKMPGVKKLHQESESNTKPEYIMGHSCQAIGVLVNLASSVVSIPLVSRIHEGVKFSNRDKLTLLDKFILMFTRLSVGRSVYFVADAYYASAKVMLPLLAQGHHLISRVRSNSVAYRQPVQPEVKGRGAPRKYGEKVYLRDLFDSEQFISAPSPLRAESGVEIQYCAIELVWKAVGRPVQFILVKHPTRGNKILVCTDIELNPLQIIQIYGIRFKIEVSFKQAIHTIGAYGYHFWMKNMVPIKQFSGTQYLHRKTKSYRIAVKRKIKAYHAYMQAGTIAQGILQILAITATDMVWNKFGSWMRTTRKEMGPSEFVTARALQNSLPEFLEDSPETQNLKKFLTEKIDQERDEGCRLFEQKVA